MYKRTNKHLRMRACVMQGPKSQMTSASSLKQAKPSTTERSQDLVFYAPFLPPNEPLHPTLQISQPGSAPSQDTSVGLVGLATVTPEDGRQKVEPCVARKVTQTIHTRSANNLKNSQPKTYTNPWEEIILIWRLDLFREKHLW